MAEMAEPAKPQFKVTMPTDLAYGSSVFFNGQEIKNVSGVAFKTEAYCDDLVRSTITIELVGEPILTSQ